MSATVEAKKRSDHSRASRDDYVPHATFDIAAPVEKVTGHPTDKYRFLKINAGGLTKTLFDRRANWALEVRELNSVDELSGGERTARRKFWERLTNKRHASDPVGAVSYALGLERGPIPELQTEEEFREQWTPEKLARIAARWKVSPLTPNYVREQMRNTRASLMADAQSDAEELSRLSRDKSLSPRTRAQILTSKLAMAFKVAGPELEGFAIPDLVPANYDAIYQARLQVAAGMKDTARAALVCGLLGEWLADNKPVGKTGRAPVKRVVMERVPLPGQPAVPQVEGEGSKPASPSAGGALGVSEVSAASGTVNESARAVEGSAQCAGPDAPDQPANEWELITDGPGESEAEDPMKSALKRALEKSRGSR